MAFKRSCRKIWYFIWEDNSVWSWIVNVILAYIIIKFIFYPGIGFLLHTEYPAVGVVSCSMEHNPDNCWVDCYNRGGDLNACKQQEFTMCGKLYNDNKKLDFDGFWQECGKWYENMGIARDEFRSFDYNNGFNLGDIFIVSGRSEIHEGDIIIYSYAAERNPIIHRVVEIIEEDGEVYYKTKGDHNSDSSVFEQKINKDRVFGKAIIRIPELGWVKIWMTLLLNSIR